ncbi:MAG: hypothetical protein II818_00300 [Aeriscardovia sp.]|nr:hypothetical protein [Aeriscardovia sp.]
MRDNETREGGLLVLVVYRIRFAHPFDFVKIVSMRTTFKDMTSEIEKAYGNSNESMGTAYERVAAYFLEEQGFQVLLMKDQKIKLAIEGKPITGIDILGKKGKNLYSIQVVEHMQSDDMLNKKLLINFIRSSEDMDIPEGNWKLFLFYSELSEQEKEIIKDYKIEVITEDEIEKQEIDWSDCQW